MASLQSRISDLITAIGTDIKQLRTWITGSSSGDLTGLTTTTKTSIVAAINEDHGEHGDLTALTTTAKGTFVAAINEVKAGNTGAPPDASETVKGIAELATLAEVSTGTDTSRIVTPAGVRQEVGDRTTLATAAKGSLVAAVNELHGEVGSAPDASTTVKGIAELATLAEVATGTDTTRIVTPEGVRQERAALKTEILAITASDTVQGLVELATLAEVAAGTDSARAVTAAGVKQETDAVKTAILNGAPGALDTLDELAAALGDDANFATTVTNSLANKQPLDADLTAIAALASAADKMPYSTGAQAWSLATLTAAGRAILDDTDAAAQRTTLSVYSQAELGNPDTDLSALYTTAKT